jgi:hypothetical protein
MLDSRVYGWDFFIEQNLQIRIRGDGQYCLARIFIYMMNMYDILREDEETQDNQEPTKDIQQEKSDFGDTLLKIANDTKLLNFKTSDDTVVVLMSSSSDRNKGNLRFFTDIKLDSGKQISGTLFLEIFKHVYDGCIKHGLHKFSDEVMGNSKISLSTIEIRSGRDTNGEVSIKLNEIIPDTVYGNITFEFGIFDLFGSISFKESLSLTDLSGKKDTTPSYDNLNARVQAALQRSLFIPDNVLPKFPENFEEERQKLIKRGKSIYLALSKGTYNGKPYTLGRLRFVYLYSTDRLNNYHDEAIDKKTNTIKPNFDISCFGDIDTYDGQSAHVLAEENWDEYYKLKQHVQKVFKKYGISFT